MNLWEERGLVALPIRTQMQLPPQHQQQGIRNARSSKLLIQMNIHVCSFAAQPRRNCSIRINPGCRGNLFNFAHFSRNFSRGCVFQCGKTSPWLMPKGTAMACRIAAVRPCEIAQSTPEPSPAPPPVWPLDLPPLIGRDYFRESPIAQTSPAKAPKVKIPCAP